MDQRTVLVKCLTLIYRESQLDHSSYNNADLVKTVLEKTNGGGDRLITNGQSPLQQLKDYILNLIDNRDGDFDSGIILQDLKIILENEERVYESIEQGIVPEYQDASIKRIIVSLSKQLSLHYRELCGMELVNKASYDFKFKADAVQKPLERIRQLHSELEPFLSSSVGKDPAIMDEFRIDDVASVSEIIRSGSDEGAASAVYKFGWQGLNRMLQGGIRPGDFMTIYALQHKYKTGFSLSLLAQLAKYNTPVMRETKDKVQRKPILIRFGFEDKSVNNLDFLYQILKGDMQAKVCPVFRSEYLKEQLEINGFGLHFIRVNPTLWSYLDIMNKIIDLESQGFEVKGVLFDYLALVPTTGCTQGPLGTDRRDFFRRLKNFFQARDTFVITPHQISTDAKQLIRNGIPNSKFVSELPGKGYSEGSKQLDQEVDIELYIHLVPHKGKTYLNVQRGKHRLPTNVADEYQNFYLPFPDINTPIPDDLNGEEITLYKLPKAGSGTSSPNAIDDLY